MNRADRIWENLNRLVAIPSDTGTCKEKEVEKELLKILSEIEYFKEQETFGKRIIKEDYLGRSIIWGLVRGESNETIVLMHHHDVVDASDYGELAEYAYDMEQIKEKLYDRADLPQEVLVDLQDKEWVFGRGTADMKAGAAIQLALLEEYSKLKYRFYNVLLLSVPDEENMSVGMRKATTLLKELKEKYGLAYKLLINSEPHERSSALCGTIYTGSVGKLMPVIYAKGKIAHIGNAYAGINPISILSQMMEEIELSTDFCDRVGDEVTMPPTIMYLRDRKQEYNVSTPASAGMYFSLLLLTSSVEEVTHKLEEVAHLSSKRVMEKMHTSYEKYCKLAHIESSRQNDSIKIKLFGQLYKEALTKGQNQFKQEYKNYQSEIKKQLEQGKINLPESTFLLIEKVLEYISSAENQVIIAYAPPYYPNVHIENSSLVQALSQYAKIEWNETYEEKKYFMGISDMSYVGNAKNKETQKILQAHMPQWQELYEIPFEDMEEISMPMINIGPWGKDLHQWSERVYRKDVLEHTPSLIWKILNDK